MDNTLRIASAAVTDRGLSDKRPQNEDSYIEMPKSGIFAVGDGVGGAQAGEVASQMAMEIIGEAFANLPPSADAEDVLRTAIERANAAIYQMAQELPQLSNMASTVVALHLDGDVATIAHVGDSRAYSVNPDGDLTRLTDDHSMVADEVRAGRMTEEQAENHPNKNIISRALGAEPTVRVDSQTIMVSPGTAFLICSDGITRHVNDAEIKGVLTFGGDPVDICEYLRGLCYERGAEDNLTAVVIKTSQAATAPQPLADEEETTVATVRSPFDTKADDDAILELENGPPRQPLEQMPAQEAQLPTIEQEYGAEAEPIEDAAWSARTEAFSMFGDDGEGEATETRSGGAAYVLTVIAALLAGAAIGFGAYYFFMAPQQAEPSPPVSEMRSANIPLSAFEENRRKVDQDPAAYIQKYPQPQDAEDFYLIGRAYLLAGDYARAKTAFAAARDRLAGADPTNVAVLRNDLAMLLAVTSDTTIQSVLKKELELINPGGGGSNANGANSPANR